MNNRKIDEYIESNFDKYISDLIELLSQPSISTTNEGVKECTKMVQEFCKRYGFDETKKIETSGQPSIIAKAFVDHDPKNTCPTLLIYGHYDVQPVDPENWTTSPFEPNIREGPDGDERIYARGAGDNKGQWFAHLCAIKSLRKNEGLPMNVTLILEGEEENGSPNFQKVVRENKEELDGNLVYVSDGPIDGSNRPHVLLGARGLLYVEIQAKGPNRDLHSGNFGGPTPNPALELIRIVDSMKDDDGRVTIEGFYDDVREIQDQDREVLKKIPLDAEKIKKDLGIKGFAKGLGDSYHEKLMYYPTLNVPGFTSGYGGEGTKTIIPSKANVKIDMRLAADQDPDDIFNKFSKHVRDYESGNIEIDIIYHDSMKPQRTPLNSPYIEPIMDAVRDAWQLEPILKPSIGASLPSYVFTEELGIDCILVPYANADENNHSPDENLSINCFKNGIKTTYRVINNLANS